MPILKHTAEIVEAYVSKNEITAKEVPELIHSIHQALTEISGEMAAEADPEAAVSESEPAVPIDQAVSQEAVTCLICGKGFKTLKGHLTKSHNMDVKAYRHQFDLPIDFPMVAPSTSEKRRKIVQKLGLGEKKRDDEQKNL